MLILESILDHIENKGLKKKIHKKILENRPHISLYYYNPTIPVAKQEMFVLFNKALDAIEKNDIKIGFNTVVAEAQKGSPIQIYSAPNHIEATAY